MNEQLQPLKKQPRAGKAGRSETQDDIVYAHIFEAILEQRLAPGTKLSEEALGKSSGSAAPSFAAHCRVWPMKAWCCCGRTVALSSPARA